MPSILLSPPLPFYSVFPDTALLYAMNICLKALYSITSAETSSGSSSYHF